MRRKHVKKLSLEILNLLHYMPDTQESNLSSREIAKLLKMQEQLVINTMRTLWELGLIHRVRGNTKETRRHGHNARSSRFLYTIADTGKILLASERK